GGGRARLDRRASRGARIAYRHCPRGGGHHHHLLGRASRWLARGVGIIRMSLTKSSAAFARAKRLIPGGVNSPARAFGGVGGEPLFFARGEGAHLVDLDGNRYLDYIGSWGPLILGHAHP